jgi:ankyrin repeat protein
MSESQFSEALTGLMNGDFTRLAPLFAGADGSSSQLIRWLEAGLFQAQPGALGEGLTCACFNGCVEGAERLLACGLDPSGGAATGLNAFHWAANRGQLEVVRLLLRHGASLEVRNSYQGTVLGCAVWSAVHEPRPAHLAIVEALLEAGAIVSEAAYPSGDAQIDALLRRFGAGGSNPAP